MWRIESWTWFFTIFNIWNNEVWNTAYWRVETVFARQGRLENDSECKAMSRFPNPPLSCEYRCVSSKACRRLHQQVHCTPSCGCLFYCTTLRSQLWLTSWLLCLNATFVWKWVWYLLTCMRCVSIFSPSRPLSAVRLFTIFRLLPRCRAVCVGKSRLHRRRNRWGWEEKQSWESTRSKHHITCLQNPKPNDEKKHWQVAAGPVLRSVLFCT